MFVADEYLNKILCGDCLEVMSKIPDSSIDLVVTSPSILLPKYGWPHKLADGKYKKEEMSFRLTINALNRSDRGFTVVVNKDERKVMVSFDGKSVDIRHSEWLKSVIEELVSKS